MLKIGDRVFICPARLKKRFYDLDFYDLSVFSHLFEIGIVVTQFANVAASNYVLVQWGDKKIQNWYFENELIKHT